MPAHRRIWGSSIAAMAAMLVCAPLAGAQSATAPLPAQGGDTVSEGQKADGEILVTGTRASLQSASQRKKKADTVVDSIVAEDVASFPDKNVGEALARVTGVQLERDFGEGVRVAIRGVQLELNRVGPNGVAYTNTGPGLEYRPRQRENGEKQLKLDVDYDLDWGFLTKLKFGGQYRDQDLIAFNNGGSRIFKPEVRNPRTNALITPAVTQYNNNITYSTNIGPRPAGTVSATTYYFSPEQYNQFLLDVGGTTTGAPVFGGLNVPGLPGSFATPIFDPGVLGRYYDLSNFNQDRVRFADGLPQIPAFIINEKIAAGYLRADFRTRVLGMELSGNTGVRYIYTRDTSTSNNTRRETRLREGTGVGTVAPVFDTNTVAGSRFRSPTIMSISCRR